MRPECGNGAITIESHAEPATDRLAEPATRGHGRGPTCDQGVGQGVHWREEPHQGGLWMGIR